MQVEPVAKTPKSSNRRKFVPTEIKPFTNDEGDIYTNDELVARIKNEFEPLLSLKHMKKMGFRYSFTHEANDAWLLTLHREEDNGIDIKQYPMTFRIVNDQTIPRIDQQIIEARLKFFE